MTGHVVVVGASLGGLRAAEQLRAAGHQGPITVIGEEQHLPYNRPPLSKDVLSDSGDDDVERLHASLAFRRRASVDDVEFVLGRRAVASDLEHCAVTLDDGTVVTYDGLVIATGLRARRLSVPGPGRGRHVIRTLDDALSLRASIRARPRIVVVGAGFVGCETAASLHKLGLDVTVVDPTAVAFGRAVGARLGGAIQRHLERSGIRFVMGAGVSSYAGTQQVTGVVLDDGRVVEAELVVEAVGSACNTDWLDGNGLDLTDGVLTDNDLCVVGTRQVVAVGDIARFPNPLFGDTPRRVEHWSMPTETAKRAARSLAADLHGAPVTAEPFAPTPSFWSDLLDLRLQAYGSPALGDTAEVDEGDLDSLAEGVIVSYLRDDSVVGTVAVNIAPARLRSLRDRFASPAVAAH